MKISLDERETYLYNAICEKQTTMEKPFELEKKPICLGDIHFVHDDKEILIIERKSLQDLVSSIKDGRYEEQSYRLIHPSGMYRHHIFYVMIQTFGLDITDRQGETVMSPFGTTGDLFCGLLRLRYRCRTSLCTTP